MLVVALVERMVVAQPELVEQAVVVMLAHGLVKPMDRMEQ
jgi:hypothetical protein